MSLFKTRNICFTLMWCRLVTTAPFPFLCPLLAWPPTQAESTHCLLFQLLLYHSFSFSLARYDCWLYVLQWRHQHQSNNALKLFCLPQDTHTATNTHRYVSGVQMRMTCKYVYLNVFYKNTHTGSGRETERKRDTRWLADFEPRCFVFSHCGIKPTNNLSQHEFFLPEKLWQKEKNTYKQTHTHTHRHRHRHIKNCTFAVAGSVIVCLRVDKPVCWLDFDAASAWLGLAWKREKKEIQSTFAIAVCCVVFFSFDLDSSAGSGSSCSFR